MGHIHGWLDDASYLASQAQGEETDLYRCVPPDTCQLLGRVEGKIVNLSYSPNICPSEPNQN